MTETGGVVRVTVLEPKPGRLSELLAAAAENARTAGEAPGCRTAEVCTGPADEVIVLSRWTGMEPLEAFLAWHKTIAHASLRDYSARPPESTHYTVVDPEDHSSR